MKMFDKYFKIQLMVLAWLLSLQMCRVSAYKSNYEAKYTKADIPLWKQRACEKSQKYKANSHYVCDDKGDVKCLPGWQGDLCQVPMCRKGCDPMNGYCQWPGECRCRIGYTGELCEQCIPLPGCQHGDCTKPFECICRPGWDGLFCTEPTCRQGCHNTRGYCEAPGECRCRIGWAGRNCSDCSVLPGCQHGTCTKPLECQCKSGYTGLLCQTPICNADCHKQHGYCKKPGECRCKVGWSGPNCDKCFPYPGCVNGDCEKPWECNCKSGWGGILCDEKLSYCKEHPHICENKGKCISLTKEDGSYQCHCKQGYLGKNCEIIDEFLLTSTAAPHITPPSPINWAEEGNENNTAALNNENESQSSTNNKKNEKDLLKLQTNETLEGNQKFQQVKNITLSLNISNSLLNIAKLNNSEVLKDLDAKQKYKLNSTADIYMGNKFTQTTAFSNNETKAASLATNSIAFTTSPTLSTKTPSTSSTISPLSKLDDEKNLLNIPAKQKESHNKKQEEIDDDEECTDDNDDECEYVDEDEDEDDDDDDF